MSKEVVARYFEMWNGGDSSTAEDVLSPDWVDHAHPEVVGPAGVRRAVDSIRAGQPDLRFRIDAILSDGELIAAVGTAVRDSDPAAPETRLIWLVRMKDSRMAEMWTYRNTSS